MDELTLDEKKYVSSKQAAKLTGYAKDYVGQLCREGRVQAQLVGRAWYVLESSILDHRYGSSSDAVEGARISVGSGHASPIASPVWDSPRYMPSAEQMLPQIKRSQTLDTTDIVDRQPKEETWSGWLEAEDSATAEGSQNQEDNEAPTAPTLEPESVLSGELMADHSSEIEEIQARMRRRPGALATIIRAASLLIVLSSLLLVALNSGYLDAYTHSFSRASVITGIHTYIKEPI